MSWSALLLFFLAGYAFSEATNPSSFYNSSSNVVNTTKFNDPAIELDHIGPKKKPKETDSKQIEPWIPWPPIPEPPFPPPPQHQNHHRPGWRPRPYNATNLLPSIRLYPNELHLCMGTFVTDRIVLTTANCVFGQPVHRLFVFASNFYLDRTYGVKVNVKKVITHPRFEVVPEQFDFGMILLTKRVHRAAIFYLPVRRFGDRRMAAVTFGWKFNRHRNVFYQYRRNVNIMSRAKCALILKEYVDCNTVCTGNGFSRRGSYDEGAALAMRFRNRNTGAPVFVIVGIFARAGLDKWLGAEKYQLIYPAIYWIKRNIWKFTYWRPPIPRPRPRPQPQPYPIPYPTYPPYPLPAPGSIR